MPLRDNKGCAFVTSCNSIPSVGNWETQIKIGLDLFVNRIQYPPPPPLLLLRRKHFVGKPWTAPIDLQHWHDPFEPHDIRKRAGRRCVRGCCWTSLTLMFVPLSSWLSASIESPQKTPLSMKNNPSLLAGLRCTCYNNRICKELWADLIAYHVFFACFLNSDLNFL